MAETGDTLGRYTLLKRLAAGGMGEIYLAARAGPLGFAPPIALKVLREELASDRTFVEMLVDEAKISMFLNHQNVVSVTDFGEQNGRYYIAMEYVQGITLKQLLEALRSRGKRLDLALALYVAGELCRALKYAHTRTNHAGEPLNIIHRDVTPGNVLLSTQGEVKLTDFGIARAKNRVHETAAGVLKGKFGYMAPEMLRYEKIDLRADLFCAGVMLYEMAAGQHPVEGAGIMDAIQRLEEKNVSPPSVHNRNIPPALDVICMRALEPKPDARWGSAAALGAALQDLALADPELRKEIRSGGGHLAELIRELFPEVFNNPIPPDLAERFLREARERERQTSAELDRAAAGPIPQAAAGEERTEERNLSDLADALELHPVAARGLDGLSRAEVASMPTAHAILSLDHSDDAPPTLIPTHGRRVATGSHRALHQPVPKPRNGSHKNGSSAEDKDTDEHQREALARAARGDSSSNVEPVTGPGAAVMPAPRVPETATLAFRAPDLSRPDSASDEIIINFPDSSTDRSRLRDELIEEPSIQLNDATIPYGALSNEAISRAHADERTVAAPDAFGIDDQPIDDGKTVASGVPVPDWRVYNSEPAPAVRVIDPAEERRYDEGERPNLPQRTSAYDDAATAFEGPPPLRDDPLPDSGDDHPTMIPDDEPPRGRERTEETPAVTGPGPAAQDDTLLDGLNVDDVHRAKAEAEEEAAEATRLRADPHADDFVWEDSKELGAPPKKLSGPLRIRVNAEGSPAIATSTGDLPPAPPLSLKRSEVLHQDLPRPKPASEEQAAAPQANPIIGSATGRWIRGELPSSDLSWGDDAAARRAVATRNVNRGQSPQATSVGQPVAAPHPAVAARPVATGFTTAGPQNQSQNYPVYQGQPGGQPVHYPAPHLPQQNQRNWLVPVAISLAVMALATVLAVLLLTRAAWPEVTFESAPRGALVLIDGKALPNKTPVTLKVKPNAPHKIELRMPGFSPKRIEPAIEIGYLQSRTYAVTFEEVRRAVYVSPVAARVLVNDQLVGEGASVQLPQLTTEGPVTVRVEADGYKPWSMTFEGIEQVPASLDVPLQRQ